MKKTDILQSLVASYQIAYLVTDRSLRIVEIQDPQQILSIDQEACLGCALPDVMPELEAGEALLAEILAGQQDSYQLEWVNRTGIAGETIYLTMTTVPFRKQDGEIDGLLFLAQDVSNTARLHQRLMQHRNDLHLAQRELAAKNLELAAANAELQRLDSLKSAFVSVAAHELGNPLAAIIGYVELLIDGNLGELNEDQLRGLEVIQNGAHRLQSIASNLLDLTRIEAGRMELFLQPLNLASLVRQAAGEHELVMRAKDQKLALHLADDLPAVLCDETRTWQIIGNLLSNASKYTPAGGGIEVRLEQAQEEGFLLLTVADTGVGIAEEDQARLFQRFFRTETAYRSGVSGTGLGLHITHSLVELHGGRIWFESQVGQGSTFYVTLPVAMSDP